MPEVTVRPSDDASKNQSPANAEPNMPAIVTPTPAAARPPEHARHERPMRERDNERGNSGEREYIVIADWGSMPRSYVVGDRFFAKDCPYSISEGLRKKAIRRVRPSDNPGQEEDED